MTFAVKILQLFIEILQEKCTTIYEILQPILYWCFADNTYNFHRFLQQKSTTFIELAEMRNNLFDFAANFCSIFPSKIYNHLPDFATPETVDCGQICLTNIHKSIDKLKSWPQNLINCCTFWLQNTNKRLQESKQLYLLESNVDKRVRLKKSNKFHFSSLWRCLKGRKVIIYGVHQKVCGCIHADFGGGTCDKPNSIPYRLWWRTHKYSYYIVLLKR